MRTALTAPENPMRYQNPIIPGFYPDPSVCRVGQDYYLVNSSFEYFPGVPVFHSRDLVHWRQIGHCLTRESQLPLDKAGASGGIYAPTIRHHDGVFYMVTTNVTGGGNFYVTASDPAGPWSEPIRVRQGGIDPSLFWDGGKAYFASTGQTGEGEFPERFILQSEIDLQTGELLCDPRPIWHGSGGKGPEGPHMYKIHGVYYLMIAEGGTEYGHIETIARADSPWGPFEACPRNPILTHRSLDLPIQITGHADLIQAQDDTWWLVFLGVRPVGYPPAHHLGRETFLAPVRWDSAGWPVIGKDGTAALEMEGPDLPAFEASAEDPRDDFDSPDFRLCWNFLRNPRQADYSLTARPGCLQLHGSEIPLHQLGSPTWLGRRQCHFDCLASAEVEFEPAEDNEEAGLVAWMNERHHYEVFVTTRAGARCVVVRRRIGSLWADVACEPAPAGAIVLAIRAGRSTYEFLAGPSKSGLQPLASGETRYLSTEVGGMFTGVYLAMYATGNGQPCAAPAWFDWFSYEPSPA
jgi:xylan 1,4-beta-xylosidase